jgi:predicted negative regulator of RcsB-dependent stress response
MLRLGFRASTIVAFVAFAAWPALGQRQAEGRTTGNITGQVRYGQRGEPAFNILVSCDSFGGGMIGQENTDRNGKFAFHSLNLDQYTITVRVAGYVEERQTVMLQRSPDQYLQINLRPDGSRTEPVAPRTVIDASVPAEAQKEFRKGEDALAGNSKAGIEDGIRHLEKAVNIYPRFLQAHLKLGTAYMDRGEWDKAEQSLRRALEIDPKTANALFALGEVYLLQKKDDEAEKVLLQGLKIEDRSYTGHLTLGRVYWDMASKLKDDAQARPLLSKSYVEAKRTLELNQNLPDAHLLKGNLLLRVRRLEDALKEFEEYLRLDPHGKFAEPTRDWIQKIKKALAQEKK